MPRPLFTQKGLIKEFWVGSASVKASINQGETAPKFIRIYWNGPAAQNYPRARLITFTNALQREMLSDLELLRKNRSNDQKDVHGLMNFIDSDMRGWASYIDDSNPKKVVYIFTKSTQAKTSCHPTCLFWMDCQTTEIEGQDSW